MDSATSLTLDYLSAIERRLSITWDENNLPVFLQNRVNPQHVYALRYDLTDLMTGTPRSTALEVTRDYGQKRIQTVGFGLVKNFDLFVKLGLVYGERLVLWDVLYSRLLNHPTLNQNQIFNIGTIACNLLLLRPIVELGGIVILPPPPRWCELAHLVAEDLAGQTGVSPEAYGLSTTLSTAEDGFIFHPYTLLPKQETIKPHEQFITNLEKSYSNENSFFHHALSRLFKDERFAYLSDVSAEDFYRISNDRNLKTELRSVFLANFAGATDQQLVANLEGSIDHLAELLEKRRDHFLKYAMDAGESSLTWVTSTCIAAASGRFDYAGVLAGVTLLDLLIKLAGSFRKFTSLPNSPVLIQAFQKMSHAAENQRD